MTYPKNKAAWHVFVRNAEARLPYEARKNLPTIRPGTSAWLEWRRYFHHIGHVPFLFVDMEQGVPGAPRAYTVPAAFPSDFDLTYND